MLDVGGGKGRAARLALERGARRATAADLSIAMLAAADRTDDRVADRAAGQVACDVRSLPFRSATFDLVVCALVLGHVQDLGRALTALDSVLKPGGCLLISDFHPFATLRGWQRTFVDADHGHTFAIEQHLHLFSDYVGVLGRLGLTVEALEEPLWQGSPVVFVLRVRKSGARKSWVRKSWARKS